MSVDSQNLYLYLPLECEVIAPDPGQAGVRTRLDMSAAAVFAEKMNQNPAARSKVSCYIAPW